MKHKAIVVALSALIFLGAGCSSDSSGSPTASGGGKKGVEHKENVAELVTLAQETKTCKFEETFGFGGYAACPSYGKIKEDAPKHTAAGFKTMMNFLEDENPGVRYSGAHALGVSFYDKTFFSNEADMKRVLAAIKNDTFVVAAKAMTSPLARFTANVPGDISEVTAWAKDTSFAKPRVREEFFTVMSAEAVDKPGMFDAINEVAKNKSDNPAVRKSALYALSRTKTRVADAKATVTAELTSDVSEVATAAKYISEKILK